MRKTSLYTYDPLSTEQESAYAALLARPSTEERATQLALFVTTLRDEDTPCLLIEDEGDDRIYLAGIPDVEDPYELLCCTDNACIEDDLVIGEDDEPEQDWMYHMHDPEGEISVDPAPIFLVHFVFDNESTSMRTAYSLVEVRQVIADALCIEGQEGLVEEAIRDGDDGFWEQVDACFEGQEISSLSIHAMNPVTHEITQIERNSTMPGGLAIAT